MKPKPFISTPCGPALARVVREGRGAHEPTKVTAPEQQITMRASIVGVGEKRDKPYTRPIALRHTSARGCALRDACEPVCRRRPAAQARPPARQTDKRTLLLLARPKTRMLIALVPTAAKAQACPSQIPAAAARGLAACRLRPSSSGPPNG